MNEKGKNPIEITPKSGRRIPLDLSVGVCQNIHYYLEHPHLLGKSNKHIVIEMIDWLKSLKPQLKNEWSKEDERIRNTALSFLYEFKKEGYENAVECIEWLKSLKQGIGG